MISAYVKRVHLEVKRGHHDTDSLLADSLIQLLELQWNLQMI